MIILNIYLNNIYGFQGFEMNFSYPKKIVNSIIEEEHLAERPNFRYKKAVILMGANATGKTSLGKALLHISNFINSGDSNELSALATSTGNATFQVDFVNRGYTLHRLVGTIQGNSGEINEGSWNFIDLAYFTAEIGPKDSYETACSHLTKIDLADKPTNYISKSVGKIDYTFSCPDIKPTGALSKASKSLVLKTLKAVIGTLDPTLTDVRISKDLQNSFIIRREREEIIIQAGKLLNRESLSSGTAEGVDISFFLALLIAGKNGFYYCDEHFSYIQSDIEKRIFGLMLSHLKPNEQLIFTTHNTDMLDLNMPKHSFAFIRKKKDEQYKSSVVFASELLKRNTDSIRCAVENDMFSSIPDESLLDALEPEAANEE